MRAVLEGTEHAHEEVGVLVGLCHHTAFAQDLQRRVGMSNRGHVHRLYRVHLLALVLRVARKEDRAEATFPHGLEHLEVLQRRQTAPMPLQRVSLVALELDDSVDEADEIAQLPSHALEVRSMFLREQGEVLLLHEAQQCLEVLFQLRKALLGEFEQREGRVHVCHVQ